jgi:hypothetical protein
VIKTDRLPTLISYRESAVAESDLFKGILCKLKFSTISYLGCAIERNPDDL